MRSLSNWKVLGWSCELCGYKQHRRTDYCCNCGSRMGEGVVNPIEEIEWLVVDDDPPEAYDCSKCGAMVHKKYKFCPKCGGMFKEKKNEL